MFERQIFPFVSRVVVATGGADLPDLDHRVHRNPGKDDLERVRLELVYNLLNRDYGPFGRYHGLLLDAYDPPDRHVATPVGLLGVDDAHVRVQGRHRHQLFAGEGTGYGRYRLRYFRQVGADVAPQDCEREVRGPRDVAVGHARVGVLLYL